MSLALISILSGLFLIILVLVIYLTPTDKILKKKKTPPPPPVKNWEEIAQRWQKQNEGLEKQIAEREKIEKELLAQIEGHKKENQQLLEKLAQEKGWREKEHSSAEKVKEKDIELKKQLTEAEESLEREHTTRLQIDREFQELKITHSKVADEKRHLTTKTIGLETALEQANKELRDLRRENTELTRQKENVQWVAKTDYDELKKVLAQKEKELERLAHPSTPTAVTPTVLPEKPEPVTTLPSAPVVGAPAPRINLPEIKQAEADTPPPVPEEKKPEEV